MRMLRSYCSDQGLHPVLFNGLHDECECKKVKRDDAQYKPRGLGSQFCLLEDFQVAFIVFAQPEGKVGRMNWRAQDNASNDLIELMKASSSFRRVIEESDPVAVFYLKPDEGSPQEFKNYVSTIEKSVALMDIIKKSLLRWCLTNGKEYMFGVTAKDEHGPPRIKNSEVYTASGNAEINEIFSTFILWATAPKNALIPV
ncbi:hypothetical protein CPB84DRAFT_1965682 [Gymnopilus junonius]|uniref:Uncharacterized protein n=1 Tax=Gymnopilus junonius TaxID=109634 RepID=A0A9P5NF17_GYMJU|nr:hypothetical protein CPB84DRAFT_1965682 [Gymnopilus junonius]